MPKRNRGSYREGLIKELVKTSTLLSEFKGSEFKVFTEEETYRNWSTFDLEDSLQSDIKDLRENYNIDYYAKKEISGK